MDSLCPAPDPRRGTPSGSWTRTGTTPTGSRTRPAIPPGGPSRTEEGDGPGRNGTRLLIGLFPRPGYAPGYAPRGHGRAHPALARAAARGRPRGSRLARRRSAPARPASSRREARPPRPVSRRESIPDDCRRLISLSRPLLPLEDEVCPGRGEETTRDRREERLPPHRFSVGAARDVFPASTFVASDRVTPPGAAAGMPETHDDRHLLGDGRGEERDKANADPA